MSSDVLLKVKNLNTYFKTENGLLQAVDQVTFQVRKGELLGIVGESGCGKSITSLSIMGLTAKNCVVEADSIAFENKELTTLSDKERRNLRGGDMAMIFQEPLTSLNPLFTIGYQLEEAIRCHNKISRSQASELAVAILEKVGIARAHEILHEYPNSLSGGMRQRIMIAMALVNDPSLLIADEPTTALDVTIQAQILQLIRNLMREFGTAVMFITHDLGVVAEIADRVMVMYAGQIVEEADVYDLFAHPYHPYTSGLMGSTIQVQQEKQVLQTIPGTVPSLTKMPKGCRFAPRCPYAAEACRVTMPELEELPDGRRIRCLRWKEKTHNG